MTLAFSMCVQVGGQNVPQALAKPRSLLRGVAYTVIELRHGARADVRKTRDTGRGLHRSDCESVDSSVVEVQCQPRKFNARPHRPVARELVVRFTSLPTTRCGGVLFLAFVFGAMWPDICRK